MQYVAAFEKHGFRPTNPRKDWSAEKPDGVCITFWKSEVFWTPPPPRFDLWVLYPDGEKEWERLSGHRKRTTHVSRAMNEFDGWVDVVIVTGVPGEGVEDAQPWEPAERMDHRWKITRFDANTGYFSAAAEKRKSGA